jgi:TRAP-type transport system periplasmic protein
MGTKTVFLSALLAVSLTSTTSYAVELRLLNVFDSRNQSAEVPVQRFISAVKEASPGDLTFRVFGPEVVPPGEQFQPASSGAFDLHFTTQPYHIGTTSLSITLFTLEPDPEKFRKVGVFDKIDKEYRKHNLRLLAIFSNTLPGNGGYQAVLKNPLPATGDLTGLKMRGNPFYRPIIEALGGVTVPLPGGEIYSALERGTVDGAFWPLLGQTNFKWHEVAPYMVRPIFGYVYYFLLVNENAFNKLPADHQKILIEEARKLEVPMMNELDSQHGAEIAQLTKLGAKETHLDKDKFRAAYDVFIEGIWSTAEKVPASTQAVKDFRAFVRSVGLAK